MKKQIKKTVSKLFFRLIAVVLCATLMMGVFTACGNSADEYVENEMDQSYDKDRESIDTEKLVDTILPITEDAGVEYINGTLFIGDSNTVRSQLYGHTTWDNVVAAVSMGVQHISSLKMTYFKGYDEAVTVPKAVEIIQPQRIIITYGTNNTIGYSTEDFIKIYKEGLSAIKKAYPYADIIINSIPPVDKERENTAITMQTIDAMNKALSEMAKAEGYKFVNSAQVLKDEQTGFAKKDYTIGDGVHLSKLGMDAMFEYFRTHAYITEDTRPKPLKKVPEREETPTGIITQDPIAVRGTRIKIVFESSDTELGKVEGEVEQKIKRTITSKEAVAVANTANGGIFTGWSCSYEGLSSTTSNAVTFTVPKVKDDVTEIHITAKFKRAEVTVSDKTISIHKGYEKQLSAAVTSEFTGDKTISWASKDTEIATVDSTGKVTAVKEGKTQIVASILGGKITAVCEVEVKPELNSVKSVEISSKELSLKPGDSANLTAQYTLLFPDRPAEVDVKQTWSSEKGYVTVSDGAITVKTDLTSETGSLTDKVTVTIGGKTASCDITITNVTLVCSKCKGTGHKADAHCKWCDAVNCTETHCEKCGKTDHTATAHCKWCDEANCTKTHCEKCGETTHVAADHCTGINCTNIKCTLTHCAECGGTDHTAEAHCAICKQTDHTADAHCATCKQIGHIASDHCTGKNCTNIKCTLTHCAECGGTDHAADAHCTYSGCGQIGHTASDHCPVCGKTDHTEHPAQPTDEIQSENAAEVTE